MGCENQRYLMRYGIEGQKWGDRRFQNEDGTMTPVANQAGRVGGRMLLKADLKKGKGKEYLRRRQMRDTLDGLIDPDD